MSSTSSSNNNNVNNVDNADNVGADGAVNNPAAGDVSTASVVGNATNDVLHNRINHMRDNNARNSPMADLAKGVLGGAKKPSSSSKEGLDANEGIGEDKEGLSPAKKEGNQNNSANPGTGVATGNKPNSDNASKPGNATPKGKPSIFSAAKNGILNSTPAMAVKNGLSKIGLGPKPGLEKKDEEKSDDKDKKEGGQQETKKTSPLGLGAGGLKIGKFKISITVISVAVAILAILLVVLMFMMVLSIILDSEEDSDICLNEKNSSTFNGYEDIEGITDFLCKLDNPLGDNYGYSISGKAGENRGSYKHGGIDLAISKGTSVYAAFPGDVTQTHDGCTVEGHRYNTCGGGYGNHVIIDHGNGFKTIYMHLKNGSVKVSKGDQVGRGQLIGQVGNTGRSTGPHLHFEIQVNGKQTYAQNAFFENHKKFMKNCGSSAVSDTTFDDDSDVADNPTDKSGATDSSEDTKTYKKLKTLKVIGKNTGKKKNIHVSGYNPQSFAYHDGHYYVQWIHPGAKGKDGLIYKYNSKGEEVDSSSKDQAVGHGNGLTYSTATNLLYSVTVSGIRDNTKTQTINPKTLKRNGQKKLKNGTSSIAYDRLTKKFVTSSGASNGKSSGTGYLYVYNSSLSKKENSIAKKRWATPGDIAAYGGIIYVTIYGGSNYIDMYNEATGDYLGSYEAPGSEIEGIDINDDGEIVLLFHSTDMLQFTGIKAEVINGSTNDSSSSDDSSSSSGSCCVTSNVSSSSTSGNYCPDGITVTGKNAGTYDLDEYVEKVVTAENGGAHPEALKALAIAARTYAINRTDNCKETIPNSTAAQVMASSASDKVKSALQSVKGAVMLYNGNIFSAQYSSFWGDCSGNICTSTFKKTPSNETATYSIPKSYVTIAHGHQYGLSQNGSNYMATEEGKTYDEILRFFYADGVEITGASSNNCTIGGNGYNGKVWPFYQYKYSEPYGNYGTIATHGCGPTAMAIVVSTLLNQKHDPVEMTEYACSNGYCTSDGTAYGFFPAAGKEYGLTVKKVTKADAKEILPYLNKGNSLVIAIMTKGTFTDGGHFIVLTGLSGNEVSVQDPGSEERSKKTYDFDEVIAKEAKQFWVISR